NRIFRKQHLIPMKFFITSLIQSGLQALQQEGLQVPEDSSIMIERPRDRSHGDFSSNIAMLLAKKMGMSPRALAEKLLLLIPEHVDLLKVEIAGPGFLNFYVNESYLAKALSTMMTSPTLGASPVSEPQCVVVDYSSPNLAKEMHVGHLRSTVIGDALVRILTFQGQRVIRQNHVGDWGTQFGMLLAHLQDQASTESVSTQLKDLEDFYRAAKKRFDMEPDFAEKSRMMVVKLQSGDPQCQTLWKTFIDISITHCQAVYQRLGTLLELQDLQPESAYNADLPVVVTALAEQQLLREDQGAQCVFLPEFKDKNNEPLPVIIQKSDGGYLYASTDLAALRYRQATLHADRILYVVDARQALHFRQIFTLARLAKFVSPQMQLEHVDFGMVLDKAGRPFKSREGGVTKLTELLDEAERRAEALVHKKNPEGDRAFQKNIAQTIAIASIKYADLSKNRSSDYMFDWDTMLSFEGNTAPYLLYAYTRMQSVLEKAKGVEGVTDTSLQFSTEADINLVKQLLCFGETIDAAAHKSMPHLLCLYLYELASLFSSFYESSPILAAENPIVRATRLRLVQWTSEVLKKGLELLGINTLDRM
ncbi:MAG: arginine--tRNA ligase, partial [Legionellaceae bacterium]|nr:arginine--tRNA ligase [Legionellaceae bacterium]